MNQSTLFWMPLGLLAPLAAAESLPTPMLPPAPPREIVHIIVSGKREQDKAIEIAEATVRTRLAGALAETAVTLVLRNPNGRDMEGEFSYPLPPDATLQGYALDVNGKMVDGVPVPKQKARMAFETEQRKGIDPGLAEWSGGNRFKTRISPIPAHGQRTITLRYTTLVQQNGAASSYRLPLDFDRVGVFRLRVEAQCNQQPQVQPTDLGNLSFVPWQQHFVLEREWKDLALKEDLVIDLPPGMAEAPAVEQHGGQYYLAKLLPAPQGVAASLPTPEQVDLIWDASGSMARVDKAPILETLRLYFAARADKPCTLRLHVLRDAVEPVQEFRVEQGDASALINQLESLVYDGATADAAAALPADSPLRLLVTDGNVNVADKPAAAPTSGLTYALVASSGVDKAALRRWGAIPLDLLRQSPRQALAAVPTWQIAGLELDGKPWEGALTNAPGGVVDGVLLLTGTLLAGQHRVAALFRSATGEQRVEVEVNTEGAPEGQLNRSFHAQNKLAALLLEPESPARGVLLRQLGEEYGIVTPGTSLLVLESLEQYLTHEVRPPASCPELRARYDASIEERTRQNALSKERHMEEQQLFARMARLELRDWYERDFSKPVQRKPFPGCPAPFRVQREYANEELNRLLRLAEGYLQLFKFDEAEAELKRVQERDAHNVEARRGLEYLEQARAAYYRQNQDTYRATGFALDDDIDEGEAEGGGDERPAPSTVELSSRASGTVAPTVVVSAAVTSVEPMEVEEEGFFMSDEEEEGEDAISTPAPAPVVMNGVSDGDEADEEGGDDSAPASGAAIRVQAWSSEAPYLAVLKAAADSVAAYAEQRKTHADTPGFYLDCADFFEQAGKRAMAVRVLSNLLEMDWENRSLLRAAAYKLRYMGETQKAISLFRKVVELFPEEPQSYRDLALALADVGQWQEAAETLNRVFSLPMDERFRGMEQIAAVEQAHLIARAQQAGKPVNTEGLDTQDLMPLEADLRVIINWDTDMSDMDLWVTDPRREKCYYGHPRTRTGGRISRDMTEGYGPEEFLIRKALPGDYKVEAHYYGSDSMKMLAPVTLYAEVYTDYGRPTEKRQTLVFRLAGEDKVVQIAHIAHTPDPAAPTTRDYQVRAGDTWERIAEKELGAAARAADIMKLNPGASADVPPATGSIIRLPKN